MHRDITRLLILALLVACAAFVVDWRDRIRNDKLAQAMDRLAEAIEKLEVRSLSTTWISGGTSHTFTLHSNTGESTTDFQRRYITGLKDEFAAYPPDVPQ